MSALLFLFSLPDAGNQLTAVGAAALNDVVLKDGEAQPLDEELAAVVAVGVVGRMARHIANIRIMNALVEGDLMRFLQLC
jgi:hypothetical protein